MKTFFYQAGLLFLVALVSARAQTQERLSLSEAVDIARHNNPSLQKARKVVEVADGRISRAGGVPNPEFGISWNESSSVIRPGHANERDISISQSIEFPTKRSNRIDVASTDRDLARLHLDRIILLVTSQVKRAYFDFFVSLKIAGSLDKQLDLLKDFQQLLNARYQTGASSYLDVVRAKVELTRLTNDIIEAKRETRGRQRRLNLFMGRGAEQTIVLIDSFPSALTNVNIDSLANSLAERSIAARISELSLRRQERFVSLAKTAYLPDFQIGIANQKRGDITSLWGIELKTSLPLWFWQEPKGQVREAQALSDIAALSEKAVGLRVRASIRNAVELFTAAEAQLRAFDRTLLADADDIVSTAVNQYQNNQIDVLNLLDIYRTHRATRVEYLRALHNYALAIAEVEASGELPSQTEGGLASDNSFLTGDDK
ncbi:MAG: TolC family protein [Ignavibacteria bacterium]|nr:TolC family protein [Ignavibacteria bacterium]